MDPGEGKPSMQSGAQSGEDLVILNFSQEGISRCFPSKQPVLVSNWPLLGRCTGLWTPEYFESALPPNAKFSVYQSQIRRIVFPDNEAQKHEGSSDHSAWSPMMMASRSELTISSYMEKLRDALHDFGKHNASVTGTNRVVLMEELSTSAGQEVIETFKSIDGQALAQVLRLQTNSRLHKSTLMISPRGTVLPFKFEERPLLLSMTSGRKRIRLLPPQYTSTLKPFPVCHQLDRYSILDLQDLSGMATSSSALQAKRVHVIDIVLAPGDVLFIPPFWWQESCDMETSVSVCFTMSQGPLVDSDVVDPLSFPDAAVSVCRDVERTFFEVIGYRQAHHWLLSLSGAHGSDGHACQPTQEQSAQLQELQMMLRHLVPPEGLVAFLLELANGRYAMLSNESASLPG